MKHITKVTFWTILVINKLWDQNVKIVLNIRMHILFSNFNSIKKYIGIIKLVFLMFQHQYNIKFTKGIRIISASGPSYKWFGIFYLHYIQN